MRFLAIFVLAVTLAAPAATATATASGLYGVVRRGPVRPICIPEKPCSVPAPGVTLVFSRNGVEVARTTTRRDGTYRIALAPGTYSVRATMKVLLGRGLVPARVVVPADRFARVDFSLDTGIR